MGIAAKRIGYAVLAMGAATFVVGGAHGALVRAGVLGRAPGASCPLGYGTATTPEQARAQETRMHERRRGPSIAAGRPAAGFHLDVTTVDDVHTWARARGYACASKRGGTEIACDALPNGALGDASIPDASSLWMSFDTTGRLSAVRVLRRSESAEAIWQGLAVTRSRIDDQAGASATTSGTATSATELRSAGQLAQNAAEYRFANYYAMLRATNMGSSYILTEEYVSLVDD